MNKKFLSAILFGALVASTGSFVSCADNDSDINQLQDQNSELKAQLAQLKSELQAELKNAASASQVAAIEAKLSAIESVNSDNVAATVAALKGNFDTQEARVIALETQVKALEGLKDVDAAELIAVLQKAKENGTADMTGLSALVDALDADVNTLVSALRGLVFQPEFYVDGIEAAEYTYLRIAPLDPKGDHYLSAKKDNKAMSSDSIDACIPFNDKAQISPKFVWQYAHRGDINTPVLPTAYTYTSVTGLHEAAYNCGTDNCIYTDETNKKSEFVPADAKNPILKVGEKVLNTITFAMNPSNAKVTEKDLDFIVKNICAMTRANEAKLNVEKVATKDGMLTVTYWIADADIDKLITANRDESYGVLNKVENTTIVKLQAATSTENNVESDWAALYETSIQPIAIALNEAGKNWNAPIECSKKDAKVYKELHKNPYEALYDPYTVAINYKSQGLDISKYIELHFLKADYEKADPKKHDDTKQEIQHPHVTMSLADAAEKFGFTYEFSLVPYSIDDNLTNPSSYAHMLSNGKEYIKDLGTAENAGSIIVPNTVDETKVTEQFVYIPKKLEDGSYEQGVSSVGKHPLVQVLVKSAKGQVILDGYVNLVIEREVESIIAPIFPIGEGRNCKGLDFSTSWNQWSELLLENTVGMSKLEFDEIYEPMLEDNAKYPGVYAQYKDVKVEDGKVTSYTKIDYKNTYTEVTCDTDPYGNTNHVFKFTLDKFDQEYIYDKADHTDIIYIAYKRKGSINHSVFQGIFVPIQVKISDVTKLEYGVKNVNFWYDKTGAPNILDIAGIETQSIRFNVNYGKDKIDTYQYENGTNNMEKFQAEGAAEAEVLGFVRDINDAWDGKALTFTGKKDVYTKGKQPTYYFHPLTKTVTVTDEYSKTVYTLDVDNDFIDEDIWVMGDDPKLTTGANVHTKTICKEVSKEAIDYVKKTEGTHQVNTLKGIYTNTKLYALKAGEKRSEANCIAEMNRFTGKVHYRYTERSKAVLNATGHRVAEEFAYIGIFLPDACDNAYNINYNEIPENIFAAYWLRPLDIKPCDPDTVIDATNNAYYISIFDKYNFTDWRDYKIVDKSKTPMDYSNVWLLAFYGVKYMTLQLDKVTTDMNSHDIAKDLLTKVNEDIKISYVEHNKSTVIGVLGAPASKPIDLTVYDKESAGVKSTYDKIVEHFGYLKYENKGANVSNFKFVVPVTFGYDWGEITTSFEVQVIGTEGNHDGE